MLSELAPDYTPSDDIVDLIEIEKEPYKPENLKLKQSHSLSTVYFRKIFRN